jgi:hypothetical protein
VAVTGMVVVDVSAVVVERRVDLRGLEISDPFVLSRFDLVTRPDDIPLGGIAQRARWG